MPFHLTLRPGASHVRDNELKGLHPKAAFAFLRITGWIESGPSAGGPNIGEKLISLDSLIARLQQQASSWALSADQVRRRVERLDRHRATGQWGFLFNLVPVVGPSANIVFILGFDRSLAENAEMVETSHPHPAREIICDSLITWRL